MRKVKKVGSWWQIDQLVASLVELICSEDEEKKKVMEAKLSKPSWTKKVLLDGEGQRSRMKLAGPQWQPA